jgi:hypothetical protein
MKIIPDKQLTAEEMLKEIALLKQQLDNKPNRVGWTQLELFGGCSFS